jgi:protein-disulfide isomerase
MTNRERLRSVVELITNLAVAAAAVALVWKLVFAPAAPTQAAGAPRAVEDVEASNLSLPSLPSVSHRGSAKARVALIEFSDYECPFCGRYARETFGEIDKDFIAKNRIQYALVNYPLENHEHALPAAVAAECAGRQGKYWEMHERLFAKQADLKTAVWLTEAPGLGLDTKAFAACLEQDAVEKVRADRAEGVRLGVNSTPTFFIGTVSDNGSVRLIKRVRGSQPYATFKEHLEEVLSE